MLPRADADLALHACSQQDAAAVAERVHRIAGDVQHCLDEELGVPGKLGDARVVVAFHDDARRRLRADEGSDPFGDFVNVHRHHPRQAPRSDHPVDEVRETVRLADDDRGVLAQRRVRQLAVEQLRRAPQPPERILDLVTEPPHQVPGIRDLGEQPLFTGDLVVTIELHQLDQDLRDTMDGRDGGQGAVDDTGLTRVERDRECAFRQQIRRVEHAVDRVQQLARGDEIRERSAASGLHAGVEQRLHGRVHLFDHRAPVEHQHPGRQMIDQPGDGRGYIRIANGFGRRIRLRPAACRRRPDSRRRPHIRPVRGCSTCRTRPGAWSSGSGSTPLP